MPQVAGDDSGEPVEIADMGGEVQAEFLPQVFNRLRGGGAPQDGLGDIAGQNLGADEY